MEEFCIQLKRLSDLCYSLIYKDPAYSFYYEWLKKLSVTLGPTGIFIAAHRRENFKLQKYLSIMNLTFIKIIDEVNTYESLLIVDKLTSTSAPLLLYKRSSLMLQKFTDKLMICVCCNVLNDTAPISGIQMEIDHVRSDLFCIQHLVGSEQLLKQFLADAAFKLKLKYSVLKMQLQQKIVTLTEMITELKTTGSISTTSESIDTTAISVVASVAVPFYPHCPSDVFGLRFCGNHSFYWIVRPKLNALNSPESPEPEIRTCVWCTSTRRKNSVVRIQAPRNRERCMSLPGDFEKMEINNSAVVTRRPATTTTENSLHHSVDKVETYSLTKTVSITQTVTTRHNVKINSNGSSNKQNGERIVFSVANNAVMVINNYTLCVKGVVIQLVAGDISKFSAEVVVCPVCTKNEVSLRDSTATATPGEVICCDAGQLSAHGAKHVFSVVMFSPSDSRQEEASLLPKAILSSLAEAECREVKSIAFPSFTACSAVAVDIYQIGSDSRSGSKGSGSKGSGSGDGGGGSSSCSGDSNKRSTATKTMTNTQAATLLFGTIVSWVSALESVSSLCTVNVVVSSTGLNSDVTLSEFSNVLQNIL